MRSSTLLTVAAICCCIFAGLTVSVQTADAFGDVKLENDDCVKCHDTFVAQLKEAGAKHKSKLTCLECHASNHPPGIEKGSMVPKCSDCHEGKPHFGLDNCLGCHSNPHQPLNITLEGDLKPACNTCHQSVVQEVDSAPSAHAEVDCTFCHDKHGYKPDCLDCHEPHGEGQQFADCVKCHQVHQPLALAYGKEVPNKDCGACHEDIRGTLEAGATKHAGFLCVFCHANKHAVVPKCQDCHGEPHNAAMLSKFEGCNQCHQSAHSLLK